MALRGGAAISRQRLSAVVRDVLALLVAQREGELGARMALLGGLAVPRRRLFDILRAPLPLSYIMPRLFWAPGLPSPAPRLNQYIARWSSCATPWPLTYMKPRLC